MKKESLWEQEIKPDKIKVLNEDIETDILIIGGGITGLSIAYESFFLVLILVFLFLH